MADLLAVVVDPVLHHPKLCQVSLGELLHALLLPLHRLDRRLFLLHGVDGRCHTSLRLVCLVFSEALLCLVGDDHRIHARHS